MTRAKVDMIRWRLEDRQRTAVRLREEIRRVEGERGSLQASKDLGDTIMGALAREYIHDAVNRLDRLRRDLRDAKKACGRCRSLRPGRTPTDRALELRAEEKRMRAAFQEARTHFINAVVQDKPLAPYYPNLFRTEEDSYGTTAGPLQSYARDLQNAVELPAKLDAVEGDIDDLKLAMEEAERELTPQGTLTLLRLVLTTKQRQLFRRLAHEGWEPKKKTIKSIKEELGVLSARGLIEIEHDERYVRITELGKEVCEFYKKWDVPTITKEWARVWRKERAIIARNLLAAWHRADLEDAPDEFVEIGLPARGYSIELYRRRVLIEAFLDVFAPDWSLYEVEQMEKEEANEDQLRSEMVEF